MIKDFNYVRVACLTSEDFEVGNIKNNSKVILDLCSKAIEENVDIAVFPELCLTGYTCADMFTQQFMNDDIFETVKGIASSMDDFLLAFIGAPLVIDNKLYNCVFALNNGKILGIVPKTFIPNYNEFYESRWFTSSKDLNRNSYKGIPIGTDLIFEYEDVKVGVDICEDLWVQNPPSNKYCSAGANIIVNCSASNELASKQNYRRNLVKMQSAKCICAYAYCSAGSSESTTDVLFSGHRMIYENGKKLDEKIYDDNSMVIADVDIDILRNDRLRQTTFDSCSDNIRRVSAKLYQGFYSKSINSVIRHIDATPFVPSSSNMKERVDEILEIQSRALAHRLKQTGFKKVVIGVSGGLDSTLALIVTCKAFDILGIDRKGINGITMPCFGTTGRTYNNAINLMSYLGCTNLECNIKEAVDVHLRDIAQPTDVNSPLDNKWKTDITFENAQARERTQILMDLANKVNGLVIGTGDLSELALGWCTYNGDHMSMYGVNTSIPKTLVQYLIEGYANEVRDENPSLYSCLNDILGTPISPELLPTIGGTPQMTESSVGKYLYNDFFMFNLLRNRFKLSKIWRLSTLAFPDEDEDVLKSALCNFVKRFYSQQFKRSCLPDGIKVGSVSLSPRGDWRCPSDLSMSTIISLIEEEIDYD